MYTVVLFLAASNLRLDILTEIGNKVLVRRKALLLLLDENSFTNFDDELTASLTDRVLYRQHLIDLMSRRCKVGLG